MTRRMAAAAIVAALALGQARAGIEEAMSAFKSGKYLESATELQTLVEQSPRYHYGWFMLGHSLRRMKRPGDAEMMFRRAVALAPDRAEYYHGLALALKDEERFGLAVEVLNAAEPYAREPRAAFALHALRGYLYAQLGQWPAAAADLERTRRIQPDPAALEMLGQAYLEMTELGRAEGALRDALALDPARPEALRLLIESLLLRGQAEADAARKRAIYAEALSRAEELAAGRPGSPDARNLVGRAALGAGQLDAAERAFESVLEADPRQCYVMVNLARVRIARRAWETAERMLQRAAACAPRLGAVFETLGTAYMMQRRWQDAAAAFRRAEEVQPSPYAAAGLAEARRRLDRGPSPVGGPPPGRR